jgi:hypothetical protein
MFRPEFIAVRPYLFSGAFMAFHKIGGLVWEALSKFPRDGEAHDSYSSQSAPVHNCCKFDPPPPITRWSTVNSGD